jgi:anti-sigma regulatory factor (Ser/Thr protein kinase)
MERFAPLSDSLMAAREARDAVRAALAEWQMPYCLDDALIVASELSTNAVRHGSGPITLTLRADDGNLWIIVRDAQPTALPEPKALTETESGGRGLHLVSAVSLRWGWERQDSTKTVWAEVGCREPRLAG